MKFFPQIDVRLKKTSLKFLGDLDQNPNSGSELHQSYWMDFDEMFTMNRSQAKEDSIKYLR